MTTAFDNQSIDIPCPNCSEKFSEKVGRLKDSPQLDCPSCGKPFQVNAEELRVAVDRLQEGVNKVLAAFKGRR